MGAIPRVKPLHLLVAASDIEVILAAQNAQNKNRPPLDGRFRYWLPEA
ncbi:MAG: hypothetical protein HY675_08925 [Chloroflexi bacterium]|nr:hypothetical protein [Chloroflexota bacterium]